MACIDPVNHFLWLTALLDAVVLGLLLENLTRLERAPTLLELTESHGIHLTDALLTAPTSNSSGSP
jgi:hypothetical protein